MHVVKRFMLYFVLTWRMFLFSVMSAMEYRLSFLLKVGGMVVNDAALFSIWAIYFDRFSAVNGWELRDMMLTFAMLMVSFGLCASFFGGTIELSKTIMNGGLDYYLALPKNVQWHISVSRIFIEAIGDFLFGLIMFVAWGPRSVSQALFYIFLALTSAFIMYNASVVIQSLAFYFGNFEETADRWYWSMFGFSTYPMSVFFGPLKLLLTIFVPVIFVTKIPVDLLRSFNWEGLFWLVLAAVISFILSQLVFRYGLRRYESGNLINARI